MERAPLEQIEFAQWFRIDKEHLDYPQSAVAIATAVLADEPGWVVFDGSRSRWYPRSQFPEESTARTILRLHVGRQLLGFAPVDARQLRDVQRREIAPETVVSEYEQWLEELPGASAERRAAMLVGYGELDRHFDRYVASKAKLTNQTKEAVYVATYDSLLELAQQGDAADRVKSLDALTVVGEKFEGYVECIAANDPQRVAELIDFFEPYWDHSLGRSYLAKAAWQVGLREEARRILEPHIQSGENVYSGEDSRMLAEIWHDAGRVDEARELLSKSSANLQEAIDELTDSEFEFGEEVEVNVADLRLSLKQNQELFQRLFD